MKHYDRDQGERRIAKLEARAERRSDWAAGRRSKANAAHDQARGVTDGIPFGQPVLSGRRGVTDRNRRAKGRAALGRAVEHTAMAEHHQGIADRAAGEIAEIERRMAGPAYDRTSGLGKGDRVADSAAEAKRGLMSGVVIRANAKSVSVQPCHACPAGTPFDEIRWIFGGLDSWTDHPLRYDWLKIHRAYHPDGTPIPSLHQTGGGAR